MFTTLPPQMFMYITTGSGASIDPCVTPLGPGVQSESHHSTTPLSTTLLILCHLTFQAQPTMSPALPLPYRQYLLSFPHQSCRLLRKQIAETQFPTHKVMLTLPNQSVSFHSGSYPSGSPPITSTQLVPGSLASPSHASPCSRS